MNIKELDKKYVLPTYARADVEFVSGENARLRDSNGKEYIDFTSGIGVVSVGHANERVSAAICKRYQRLLTCQTFTISLRRQKLHKR